MCITICKCFSFHFLQKKLVLLVFLCQTLACILSFCFCPFFGGLGEDRLHSSLSIPGCKSNRISRIYPFWLSLFCIKVQWEQFCLFGCLWIPYCKDRWEQKKRWNHSIDTPIQDRAMIFYTKTCDDIIINLLCPFFLNFKPCDRSFFHYQNALAALIEGSIKFSLEIGWLLFHLKFRACFFLLHLVTNVLNVMI